MGYRKLFLLLIIIFSYGCDSTFNEEMNDHVVNCTDFRDGSGFSFNTNEITEFYRLPFRYYHLSAVDLEGEEIEINSTMEIFLRCDKKFYE